MTSVHERYAETGTVVLCRDAPESAAGSYVGGKIW